MKVAQQDQEPLGRFQTLHAQWRCAQLASQEDNHDNYVISPSATDLGRATDA